MMKPEKMDESQIEGVVQNAVQDAVDFIESEIADDRIKAQRYFDGEVDIGEEDGRSKVVAKGSRYCPRNQTKPDAGIFIHRPPCGIYTDCTKRRVDCPASYTVYELGVQ